MNSDTLVASGGFVAPKSRSFYLPLLRMELAKLPSFTVARGGIDFSDPAERWARKRELEMRRLTKMWDWP